MILVLDYEQDKGKISLGIRSGRSNRVRRLALQGC
jgi:hypothetical protein